MGRGWHTVFRSANRHVLARNKDGGDSGEWGWLILQGGLAALAVYLIWMVVTQYWAWLLGAGAVYAAFAFWAGRKKGVR